MELVYETLISLALPRQEFKTAGPLRIFLSTISGSKLLIWKIRKSTNRCAIVTKRMLSLLENGLRDSQPPTTSGKNFLKRKS